MEVRLSFHPAKKDILTQNSRVALKLPPIPFDAYNLCGFPRHRALEIASAGVALLYGAQNSLRFGTDGINHADNVYEPDFLAFSLTIFLATTSRSSRFKMPSILETIAEDATRYFLVIFTSHFVLEMTLNLGRVSATTPNSPV